MTRAVVGTLNEATRLYTSDYERYTAVELGAMLQGMQACADSRFPTISFSCKSGRRCTTLTRNSAAVAGCVPLAEAVA